MMDRLIDNPWSVRIIAMILAVVLFFSVNGIGKNDAESRPNEMENLEKETIIDVPVEAYYDSENLVVTGVPETVEVHIEGQRRFVEATKRQRDFTIYVDLSDLGIGKHRVPILYKDISEKLSVKIEPSYVEVSIQEKVTEEFRVDAEFNKSLLAEGFEAEQPMAEPRTVKVTGAKDVIDRIAFVKATVETKGEVTSTIKREARVTVLDQELNKLPVIVEPEFVTVTVPVKNPEKSVPIKTKQTGTPSTDLVIKSLVTEIKEVTVFGRHEALESLNELEVPVDVSQVKEDIELEVPIKYPSGVNKIMPDKVKVKITTAKKQDQKQEQKSVTQVPIKSKGADERFDIEILSPADGAVSIELLGDEADLNKTAQSQFEVLAILEGLGAGEHEIELVANGPNHVKWELSTKTVKVRLKEKEENV